jgi:hypothetical protein
MHQTRITYKRTIKKLWFKGVEEDKIKFKRHALRLQFNLYDLEIAGWFNPTLDSFDIKLIDDLAKMKDPFGFGLDID